MPGKFESEPEYTKYFWDMALEGMGEDFEDKAGNLVTRFTVQAEDIKQFPILKDTEQIAVWEDEQGFVWHVTRCKSENCVECNFPLNAHAKHEGVLVCND